MMHGVVDHVARERFDGKSLAVTAISRARPLLAAHGVEAVGERRRSRLEFTGNGRGILLVVALDDGSLVAPGCLLPDDV